MRMAETAVSIENLHSPHRIPIVRELPADLETPVSVYLRLAGQGPSFLLESVTGGEQVARYSFVGVSPSQAFVIKDHTMERYQAGKLKAEAVVSQDPLSLLRSHFLRTRLAPALYSAKSTLPGRAAEVVEFGPLPRFSGGLVGYLGYDVIQHIEPSVPIPINSSPLQHSPLPDAIFLLTDSLIAFDHARGRLLLIAYADLEDGPAAFAAAEARLDEIQTRLSAPLPPNRASGLRLSEPRVDSNTSREEFIQAVQDAKEHIAAGDIFQVVLSQRFSRRATAAPFEIYRALRRLNPSPYMFFFDFADLAGEEPVYLIGASPEMHVRLEGRQASVRPIAGTRARGRTPSEDAALEAELLADPKERAEHIMLVDLARNDLGRVCDYGSIQVPQLMTVERYSHVMHIVSQVEGVLRQDLDGFDLLRATFPAGTVSGAPKIRAMQIISALEKDRRGPYAGVVGYFSFDGSMDTCITIRTLIVQGDTVSVQAGAGIVADSDPEREFEETRQKAQALAVAVETAEM